MKYLLTAFAILLWVSAAQAGEIIIIQPTGQESRSERNAARSAEKARVNQGQATGPLLIEDGTLDTGSGAQRANREAQDYLRSNTEQAPRGDEGTTVILRSAPLSDAEKSRQKAASYLQPGNTPAKKSVCRDDALLLGTIGDKSANERTVNEKGNSSVNVNCK